MNARKDIDTIAQEIIDGKWGNGIDRINRLTDAGYDYNTVQTAANKLVQKQSNKVLTRWCYRINRVNNSVYHIFFKLRCKSGMHKKKG